jgi:hypothetical protein
MVERRGYRRYAIEGHISLKTEDGTSSDFKIDVTDVSFLGVTIYAKEKINIAGKVVDFELSSGLLEQPLAGKGRIKYINEELKNKVTVFRMGFEFVDVDKHNLLHFLNLIQEMISSRIRSMGRVKKGPSQADYFGAY